MNLQIFHSQVINLELKKHYGTATETNNKSFSLEFSNQYDNADNKIFSVVFEIEILHPDDFSLKCTYVTWFKTSEPIDDIFKSSDFPNINAPAIAFPFLRSFIGIVTLNAGYSPSILPSINFVAFNQNKIEKK